MKNPTETELPKVGSKLFFDRFVVSFERGVCGKICGFGGFMDFWQWHPQRRNCQKSGASFFSTDLFPFLSVESVEKSAVLGASQTFGSGITVCDRNPS